MKTALATAGVILLLLGTPATAHRLDEYLQATTISVEKDHIQAEIRLTPGIAILPIVLSHIDSDADGIISQSEQRAYAQRVRNDLSLTLDDDALRLRLVSFKFPRMREMMDGLGEIQLEFTADVLRGRDNRKLVFDNQHQSQIAAYLVNALVPGDPDIRITTQNRNYQQSFYELNYVQAGDRSEVFSWSQWSGVQALFATCAVFLFLWPLLLFRR